MPRFTPTASTRRDFLVVSGAALALTTASLARGAAGEADNVESLQPAGEFIHECSLEGERRRDGVVPRHANCIQVSRSRWLVIYSTHGWRGVDDERSIVWQLRRDAPDGAVVREGFFSRAVMDWRADGIAAAADGRVWFKLHGHMVAFGVPKGARVAGQPAANANIFVAKWRVAARALDVRREYLEKTTAEGSQGVEWVQFRLNEREDDLEIFQPARRMRQQGFEAGAQFCSAADAGTMNQSFCPPVPANADFTEWAECNHFDRGRLAVLKYRFDKSTGRYDWVATGPWLTAPRVALSEASLVRLPEGWLVAARVNGLVAWARSADPLAGWEPVTFSREPTVSAPLTVFRCADGVVRLFTGDRVASPQRYDRDPLYCWDVRTTGEVATSNRRVIFDSEVAKLPMRRAVRPKIDFCELFPLHGRTQLVVHGVSTRAYNHAYEGQAGIPPLNAEEKAASGLHFARLTYRTAPAPAWDFAL